MTFKSVSYTVVLATAASVLASLLLSGAVFAAEKTGREIMQLVKDRDDGNNVVMDMDMTLIDAKGNQRERKLRSFRRDAPDNPDDAQSNWAMLKRILHLTQVMLSQ